MLSVCIPIFNFDVTGLIKALSRQTERLNVPVEIVCIDDCSDISFQKVNRDTCNKHGKYFQLVQNVGRAKIRNLFLEYAQYNHLLFLDCDSVIFSSRFLKKYIETIFESDAEVICGGRIYNDLRPSSQKLLRWKYGHKKESMRVEVRRRHPNRSFITSNFAIRRDVFANVKFDERLIKYGHEDTLFGFELKKNDIIIVHIDNPVLNGYLEDNAEFIEKTEHGLSNLLSILSFVKHDPRFVEDVNIARVYKTCRKFGLSPMLIVFYTFSQPFLKTFLTTGKAGLFWFDLYKLGYFALHYKQQKTLIC
jgi:glycosyltransferase involved in cell wall biosynthesis